MYSEHHFGKYKSSVSLSKILNELPSDMKWVGKKFNQIYAEYRISQKQLESITDKRTYLVSHLLYRNYVLNTIFDMQPVDGYLEYYNTYSQKFIINDPKLEKMRKAFSHFENVICTDYKECLIKRNYI